MNYGRPQLCLSLVLLFSNLYLTHSVVAQNTVANSPVQSRFVVIPSRPATSNWPAPSGTLREWNGSFTYNGVNYPYVMVGDDPTTNQGAVITTWIVPVKIVLSGGQTFDPLSGGTAGALARTLLSPIFDNTTTYVLGGVDVGTTQYIDAFQRANFWSIVQNNPDSHLLLGGPTAHPSVLPELTLHVPAQDGILGSPFGHQVAEVDLNYLDSQVSAYMTNNNIISPTGLPIFETYNAYLTTGGICCIGGYHSALGAQTYSQFGYIGYAGDFGEDVSALSHEVGDWADNPLYPAENVTPCGTLSVGGPSGTLFPYVVHGFTYHLQDLAFLRYFGGPPDGSVNDWWTFQDYPFTQVCQNGD